jgi:dynein heavy chain
MGNCSWHNSTVVDFDEARNHYAVLLHPEQANGENGHGEGHVAPTWVPRINLCFAAEDPFVFARRHADAHAARRRAESLLRYNLYVDSMPMEDIPPLTSEQVRCS